MKTFKDLIVEPTTKKPQKSYLIDDDGNVIGNKCHNYFAGKDGLGTCNIGCQWWEDDDCCMWVPQDKWDTGEDWILK